MLLLSACAVHTVFLDGDVLLLDLLLDGGALLLDLLLDLPSGLISTLAMAGGCGAVGRSRR